MVVEDTEVSNRQNLTIYPPGRVFFGIQSIFV